ncbi:DUF2911 domain-containing protein [Opitutus sp. ER46]|uniref:DUF2911 domain-containing protein n=1 Tax=Opitutus sp. ER46 TaxID=2161864 RepID=UPI000D327F64|nr:DUF2911 domain-containing protein [Opitutus sp. ER46]PTX94398.1 hypothetical protein DB354_11645 [Opitutus sp. ER46]
MKNPLLPLVCVSAMAFAMMSPSALQAQASKVAFPQPSPTATLKQRVGVTDIEIIYSRPGAKGREIFGGLVPYGEVWRTGANAATKITFSTPIKFGGVDVAAGTYALFSIPDQKEWTVILNKVSGQWGAYRYDATNDVTRVKVAPTKLGEAIETFTIDVNDIRDDSATLVLAWQNVRVPVKLETNLVAQLVPQIEAATSGTEKADARLLFSAATFYLDHDLDLKKASAWMDAAIEQNPKAFYMYYHKARILAKLGDKAGATAAANKSIELAEGSAKAEYTQLNQKLLQSLGQ